jgi:hypothetical protein
MRASSTRQFASAFTARLKAALKEAGVNEVRTNFSEDTTFQPVRVAAWYRRREVTYLWRAFSFASLKNVEQQLQAAKAIYAENLDLTGMPKYQAAHLGLAVHLPKPEARADWRQTSDWLKRRAERLEVFEDKQSIDEKVRDLVAAG